MLELRRREWTTWKKALRDKLQAMGVWRQFVSSRSELTQLGYPPRKAFVYAAKGFTDEDGTSLVPDWAWAMAEKDVPLEVAVDMLHEEKEKKAREQAKTPLIHIKRKNRKPGVVVVRGEDGEKRVVPAPGRKPVSMFDAVQWVFEHLDDRSVVPSHAPSQGAWGMLQFARSTPVTRKSFYETFVARMLPTRTQLEKDERMRDTGQPVVDLLNRLIAVKEAAEAC